MIYLEHYWFLIINIIVDIYLGIGGGPEGVLAASALDALAMSISRKIYL